MEISGATAAATGGSTTSLAATQMGMGKDQFLTLLITQLRYQNPLEPQSNEAFVSELAQFSSLEELNSVQSSIESSVQLMNSVNNAVATSFIGREAVVAADAVEWPGEGSVYLGVEMPAAGEAVLTVRNGSGEAVASLNLGTLEAGNTLFAWDGKEGVLSGVALTDGVLPAGTYQLEVTARDSEGKTLTGQAILAGRVEGVTFASGITQLVVEGTTIPLASVLEINA